MLALVRRAGRVGQIERIELHQYGPAAADLLLDMRTSGRQMASSCTSRPYSSIQDRVRKLEERPLVAFEIDRQRERQRRDGLKAPGVQQLDPYVDVAVRFGPDALLAMDRMPLVAAGSSAKICFS